MKYYQIKELKKITSLTARTLQYYDEIGLVKPSKRSAAGYRFYSEEDLLRLQQINTLKYLGFSLSEIKLILKEPDFDVLKSLAVQAQALNEKISKIEEASKLLRYIATQIEAKQAINWESAAAIINILEMNSMSEQLSEKYQPHESKSELGKTSDYDQSYNPNRLYPIPRAGKRKEIGIDPELPPFVGFDLWNHYEVSWLNEKGKPIVATAEIYYDCSSPLIIESKSLKLYFNSFNHTKFSSVREVEEIMQNDLADRIESAVSVNITVLGNENKQLSRENFTGECIDDLDVACEQYTVEPSFLSVSEQQIEEVLYSDLLKSNCLVTGQPDWGSVQISYKGNKINREGLLRYIVSYRNHNEFHEQCIERIFMDIMRQCKPTALSVYGRYNRRGGLDINPYRSTKESSFVKMNTRLVRQ